MKKEKIPKSTLFLAVLIVSIVETSGITAMFVLGFYILKGIYVILKAI